MADGATAAPVPSTVAPDARGRAQARWGASRCSRAMKSRWSQSSASVEIDGGLVGLLRAVLAEHPALEWIAVVNGDAVSLAATHERPPDEELLVARGVADLVDTARVLGALTRTGRLDRMCAECSDGHLLVAPCDDLLLAAVCDASVDPKPLADELCLLADRVRSAVNPALAGRRRQELDEALGDPSVG